MEVQTAEAKTQTRPKKRLGVELLKLAFYLTLIYAFFGLGIASPIYSMVVLRPIKGPPQYYAIDSILGVKREALRIAGVDGKTMNAWLFRQNHPAPLVIVSHGNAGDITHRLFLAKHLIEAGASVLLYDYRGYGLSEGSPTLQGLLDDGLTVYDYAVNTLHEKPDNIVLYGESIGSGVTCSTASQRPYRGIILQSAITSLPEVARGSMVLMKAYPDWVYPTPHFENLPLLAKLHGPMLIVHGQKDTLVPYSHAQALFAAAPSPNKLVPLPDCGHNNVGDVNAMEYFTAVKNFIHDLQ